VERVCEEISNIPKNTTGEDILQDILTKLVTITDVKIAVIMKTNGSIISWKTRNNGNKGKSKEYIECIKNHILNDYRDNLPCHKDGMFREAIFDYNGSKLLTTMINKDILLLLVIEKRAYVGLTMLDVEGCLQCLDSIFENEYIVYC
jgi:predicted regulator of Ras-like GTPase activity (Roadblock/LC7/MglB family)